MTDRDTERERAHDVVTGWARQDRLDAVRTRVGVLALVGLVLFVVRSFVEVGGLTELLVKLWVLVSLPITAATGAVYLTLRDLDRPEDLLDRDGTVARLAVWVLANLALAREQSRYGRIAWRLLFAHPPEPPGHALDADPAVERAVRYARLAVGGSLALALVDQAWGRVGRLGDPSIPTLGATPLTGGESVALLGGAVLLGAVVGFLLAVRG